VGHLKSTKLAGYGNGENDFTMLDRGPWEAENNGPWTVGTWMDREAKKERRPSFVSQRYITEAGGRTEEERLLEAEIDRWGRGCVCRY
jgi:hypothetical protein